MKTNKMRNHVSRNLTTKGMKKMIINIEVIENINNINNRLEKEIIRTLDNFSRYLFIACLISTPIFLIYNLIIL